jgi:hypothetical protein
MSGHELLAIGQRFGLSEDEMVGLFEVAIEIRDGRLDCFVVESDKDGELFMLMREQGALQLVA